METKNTNHTEQSGTKTSEKIINETRMEMLDMLSKNPKLIADFYSNLFSSFLPKSNAFTIPNPFSNGSATNDFTKMFSNPFNSSTNGFSNLSMPSLDKLYEQMMNQNANMLSMLSKGINTNIDWIEVNKKQEAIIENRLEATKNIRHSVMELYNKQLDSANENAKKMVQETTEQFNVLMKQNQKLWTDMFAMFQAPKKTEEKIVKDSIITEAKKR